jgi:serine/threonine protein kinase
MEEVRDSSASIALFLEYVPQNVFQWLRQRIHAGDEAASQACAMVDREMRAGISFMNSRGLLHFDAHFQNVLTDGAQLYFTDFGLAISSRFRLSPDEAEFFERHEAYDRDYAAMYRAQWLVTELFACGREEREARLRAYARGEVPSGIPETAAAIIARDAPAAVLMTEFIHALMRESRHTPYRPHGSQ